MQPSAVGGRHSVRQQLQFRQFKNFCREFLKNRKFDQMISEDEDVGGVPRWVHIGYKNGEGKQRRQLLSMRNGNYIPMTA